MRQRTYLASAVLGLALSGSVVIGTAHVGQAGGTSIDITPRSAPAGSEVSITGAGFDGDCDVLLHWGSVDGLVLGAADVGDDGAFSTSVVVPADTTVGPSQIVARGRAHGLDGCGIPSGTGAAGGISVNAAAPRDRSIDLIGRSIDAPGIDVATIARAKSSPRAIHAIVQLEHLPEAGDLAELASLGITPLAYLNSSRGPGTAYLAAISPGVADGDPRFGRLVRAVQPMRPSDKVDSTLAASGTSSQEALDVLVMFFSDVTEGEALGVLAGLGVDASSLGLNVFGATVSRSTVQRLAAQDTVQFVTEAPEPGQLDLDNSRTLVNVDAVQNLHVASGTYLGLSGFGVQVSIHDSGVDEHHGDFAGRMITTLHPAAGGDHGTHVASIAAGSGAMSNQNDDNLNPNGGSAFQWRGMAPQAGISAYGTQTAHSVAIMTSAIVGDGVDVSNHSYSYNDGQYDATMVSIDSIIRGDALGVPARPQVFSAGNQGTAPQFGQNSGYYSLSKSCKNCIIVANLQDGGALSGGSSHGPTPDGRLKPDVGANGSAVIAAGADVDNGDGGSSVGNSYRSKGGTSMAAPAVTGVVALMLQQWAEHFGVDLDTNPPLPSTVKAILVQTAVDQIGTASGTNPDTGNATVYGPGPDWGTGYGSVDALAATTMVSDEMFVEDGLSESDVTDIHYAQVVAGQDELKVTLAWDDLPGTPNADHSAPQLVNDIDLLLVGPNGEVVQPLVLPAATQFDCDGGTAGVQTGSCSPGADPGPWPSATTAINAAPGTDRLNNVEQVVIADPSPGLWQVRVSVLNTDTTVRLPMGGTQPYSLAGVTDARADLRIDKFDSPDPVHAGEELIYTVVVANDGPDPAIDVVVLDELPDEVVYLSDDGGCTYAAAAHELTCPLGDLAAGASVSFRIKTFVEADTVVGESDGTLNIENVATVSSSTPDLDVLDNVVGEITFVQDSADLKVTKLCKPDDPVLAGETATCTIFVDNLGPSYARDVTVRDAHVSDGAFSIDSATSPDGSCSVSGDVVTCDLGSLANVGPGATGRATVTIELSATEDVDINNVAQATASTPDPDTSNNTAIEHVGVLPVADLSITKSGPTEVIAGTNATYTIDIANAGPSTAPGVVVTDLVPAGTLVLSVTGSSGATCNAGQPGNPLALSKCSFGTLAPGATRTMTVELFVLPHTLGPLNNDVAVSSSILDTDLSNNLDTLPIQVVGSADLSIVKSDSPDPVVAGDLLTYTIAVTNAGPSTANDVSVVDTLPAGTTFVSGEDGNGAVVCALVQPGTIVCDLGTMSPGATTTVYLTVLVDPSLDPGSTLINEAEVTASTADPDDSNNSTSAETGVNTEADIWLDKQAALRSGNPSNVVIYTLVVHNDSGCETDAQSTPTPTCGAGGPSDARDVVVTDVLPLTPKKLTVQYLSPQCLYDAGTHTVTCSTAEIPAGASVTFVIEAQIQGSVDTIINEASVAASTFDPDLANNTNAASIVHQGGTGGKGGGGGKGKTK